MGNTVADQQDKLPTRILECKTANPFARSEWGEPGTDQVPMGYLCQCLWYMAITGIEQCDLAVLLGNSDFRIYEIERDLELEALVIEKALHFWHEYVLKDIAPPAQTEGDYQALFQKSDPTKIVEASPLIVDELRKVAPLQAQMEATENELSHIKQLLMSSMQDAEILRFQGKTLATWKLAKATKRLDIKSLEKDHPQLVSQYQMISPGSRRFLLKSLEN
jgi:predicted phage-related endonuclease